METRINKVQLASACTRLRAREFNARLASPAVEHISVAYLFTQFTILGCNCIGNQLRFREQPVELHLGRI